MGAGEIYLQAGQNIANSLSGAINQYHQEHVAYDQQYQLADVLSRMAINAQGGIQMIDPNNKDKTLQPILDPKAVQMYQTNAHDQQMKATGALQALTHMAQTSMGHLMTAAQQSQPPKIFQTGSGQQFYRFPGGGSGVLNKETSGLTPEMRAAQQQRLATGLAIKQAKGVQSQVANQFGDQYGITDPTEFLRTDVEAGNVDAKGNFTPVPQGQAGGTHIRIGSDGVPIPQAKFVQGRTLASQYQKFAGQAYGVNQSGQANVPVKVNSPQEARDLIKAGKLKPGMIYVTPDGQPYRVPASTGVDTGISGVVGGGQQPAAEEPADSGDQDAGE